MAAGVGLGDPEAHEAGLLVFVSEGPVLAAGGADDGPAEGVAELVDEEAVGGRPAGIGLARHLAAEVGELGGDDEGLGA